MRSQRQLPALKYSGTLKNYLSLLFGFGFPLSLIALWFFAVYALFTTASAVYLLPYFAFISLCVYMSMPILIYSAVQLGIQRHLIARDYEAIDGAYSKTLKLVNYLRLNHGGVRTYLMAEIGRMRLLAGQFESAESFFMEAIASTVKSHRTPGISKAILYFNLAGALRRQGLYTEANDRYDMGMKFLNSNDSKTLAFLSFANLSIAALKIEQNDLSGAEERLLKAKELMDRTDLQQAFPTVRKIQAELSCLSALTLVLLRKGDMPGAEIVSDKFLTLANQHLCEITSMELKTLNLIAAEYLALNQNERAERFLEIAYAVARDFPFHPDSELALDCFEKLLLITDRKTEVGDMRRWLRPVNDGSIDMLSFDSTS